MVRASSTTAGFAPAVLLTGFEPFGGEQVNPSWLVAQGHASRQIAGHRVVAACLSTTFDHALVELRKLMEVHQPALVICMGQAGGRAALSLERVAININDARIADNRGSQPIDTPVVPAGPSAYFTTLPIKAMLHALQAKGIPAEISQTAGTFVCNHVFYGLMHELATHRHMKHTRGGFIHVPWLPEQGRPAMPLELMQAGVHLAIQTVLATPHDIRLAAGALS